MLLYVCAGILSMMFYTFSNTETKLPVVHEVGYLINALHVVAAVSSMILKISFKTRSKQRRSRRPRSCILSYQIQSNPIQSIKYRMSLLLTTSSTGFFTTTSLASSLLITFLGCFTNLHALAMNSLHFFRSYSTRL